MELFEKTLESKTIFEGIVVKLKKDKAELCDGSKAVREVVEHAGGVTVIPVDDDGNCYMVRQFRYPMQKTILEAPAGKLEKNEEPEKSAKRELSEETGFDADEMIWLGSYATSPGYSTEVLHVYLARKLKKGESHPDEGEFLNVEKYKFDYIYDLAVNRKIEDAKTMIAIMMAAKYIEQIDQ